MGGIVAAVTRPTGFDLGSWLAAYLVLVGGVAQIAVGTGQATLSGGPAGIATLRNELLAWNLSLVLVVAGTLLGVPIVTSLGGVLLIGALTLFLLGVRSGPSSTRRVRLLFEAIVVVVAVSVPIGLVVAWIRHG